MTDDQSVLSVLESLAQSSDQPQRKIAAKTGLNLAKVNFVLKKLVDKGFVKLKRVRDNPHKLRYLYLLTPEGVAEKSRLTYRFLQRTLKQYQQLEEEVRRSMDALEANGIRRVVLWGQNEVTGLCLKVMQEMNSTLAVVGVVDPQGKKAKALEPAQVKSLGVDAVIVCEPEAKQEQLAGLDPGLTVWRLV